MLDPDIYFEDALEKQRLRSNIKYPRQHPNYHKLNIERYLVPIVLQIKVRSDLVIQDRFDWDLGDEYKSPYIFAQKLCSKLGLGQREEQAIASSILDQIIEHIDRYTIQTRTRIPKRIEEQAANNLTCLQCDSILYSHDICRACGVSLEKLRQKYGHIAAALGGDSKEQDEENSAPRQTERQKTLESSRRRQEPSLNGVGKKLCARCGETNHPLSIECKACSKPLGKHAKKLNSPNQAMTYHFWKMLNKDPQIAHILMLSENVKEEDFSSLEALYAKLKKVISDSDHPPINAGPLFIHQMLESLAYIHDKVITSSISQSLNYISPTPDYQFELKELDVAHIHSAVPYSEPGIQPIPTAQVDYRRKLGRPEIPGRKRGRPRKNPLPENLAASNPEATEHEEEAKMKEDNDMSMCECGVCGDSGELICCEVCPAVYHLGCLNLKSIPKGKWLCLFCKVVRDGVHRALLEDNHLSQSLNKLMAPRQGWKQQALQIVNLLILNPCSRDFTAKNLSHEIPPLDFNGIKELIIEGNYYTSLEDVDRDIRNLIKHMIKANKKKNQVLYSQAFSLQLYHNKIISELQTLSGVQINTQPINIPTGKEGDPVKKIKFG
jgi:hypothetical protein